MLGFPDAVGWAEFLAMVHIALAEILYPAAAVPAPNPWNECAAAVTAGEQSGIAVGCGVATVGFGIGFQQCLYLFPFFPVDDHREEVLVSVLLVLRHRGNSSPMGFGSVIHQQAGVAVFPVAEGRFDNQPFFLLLPVTVADLVADVLGIVIVHDLLDTNNQFILIHHGVQSLGDRNHSHIALPQVVDEQGKFFADTDWEKVDSPVERLPLLARELKKGTRPIKGKKATDAQLFIFAQDKDWKSKLNSGTLERVVALIDDYERCLKHIRSCRSPSKETKRKADIERILYRRGQENVYDTDELYALFQTVARSI